MADAKNNGYFWNSDNADRVYDADSFSNWLKKFFTTGVFSGDLMVTPAGGMSLSVSPGYCNIEGKVRIFEGTSNLTLDPASANYPRIDSVVITCDYTKRSIDIGVLKGSYSGSNPAPADLTRNMSMYQIALAQVKVGAGTTTITEADITDTRADSTLCGLVTGTVHEINIDGVTKQYAQIFSDWFQSIKDKLSGDTAGNLQKQIDELTGKINADTNAIDQIIKNTAQIETAGSATSAHSAGEYVMISNALYKVTASVAKGDTWTIGTNVTAANVGNEIASLKSNLANHSALHVLPLSDIADAQNGFNIKWCNVAIQGKIVLCWISFGMDNISIPQWNDFALAKLKSGYYPAKTIQNGPVGIIQEQTSGLTGEIRVIDNAIKINTHAVSFNSTGGWCWGFVAYVLD